MAEQEIIKHTKKVYKIWNSNEHSFWQKFKEFLLEIFIIVFAVSVSIWLHDVSDHNHQQKEVKEFLLGLREDLASDIHEMNEDRKSYVSQGQAFNYITNVKLNEALNEDSLHKYQLWLSNTTQLQQNSGRFEGFKASGKIGTIEDQKIQNDIMDLYQEDIPSLLAGTEAYIRIKHQLFDYRNKNLRRITDSTTNLSSVLVTDEAQNICSSLSFTAEIIGRYDICINKMKTIISRIEKRYNLENKKAL